MNVIDRKTFQGYFEGKDLHVEDAKFTKGIEESEAMQRAIARAAGEDGVVRGAEEVDKLYTEVNRWFNDKPAIAVFDRRLHMKDGGATAKAVEGMKLAAGIRKDPNEAARNSVVNTTQRHARLVKETGIGTHYGDGSSFAKLDAQGKADYLKEKKVEGAPLRNASELTESSCIGWTMEHVGAYYRAAGKPERWREIEQSVQDQNMTGVALARELQKDGWKVLYNNPNTSFAGTEAKPDNEHTFSHHIAKKDGKYYGVPIDGMVTDWEKDPSKLKAIQDAPFFVHVARGGDHVTVGTDGAINELARKEGPDAKAIYQDPMKNIIDAYEQVYSGDDRRAQAMRLWGSGMTLLPPGSEI